MKKTRKLTSLLLAVLVIFSAMGSTTFAANAESINTIFFEETDFEGLSELERGKTKLSIMGFDEDIIEELSENEIITKYANAISYSINNKYYKEVPASSDIATASLNSQIDNGPSVNLVEITEEEFLELSEENIEELPAIQIGNMAQPMTENTNTYGTLKLTTGATHQGSGNYYFWSRYEWTTAPDYRGKDIFGFSKDSNVALNSSDFYSVTKYTQKKYQLYAGTGGVTSTLLSTNEIWDERYEGEWDYNGTGGYAVEANLPSDVWPVQMLQGTFQTGYLYSGMKGYMSCNGSVTHPTLPTTFNVFTTYAHQTASYILNFDVSIPAGASISVQPTSKYDTKSCSVYEVYN